MSEERKWCLVCRPASNLGEMQPHRRAGHNHYLHHMCSLAFPHEGDHVCSCGLMFEPYPESGPLSAEERARFEAKLEEG